MTLLAACSSHTPNIDSTDPYEQYLWLIQLTNSANDQDVERVKQSLSAPAALVREGAVLAIGNLGRAELLPLAVERMSDSDPVVRSRSVTVLSELRSETAQARIQEKMRLDSSVEVRRAAAKSLRLFKPSRALLQDLIAALDDKDGGVSVLAHASLKELTQQEALERTDSKGWLEWLAKTFPQ